MILTPDDIRRARDIAIDHMAAVRGIVDEVAEASGIRVAALVGRQRNAAADHARQLVMYVARREGIPEAVIALALNRDRSTVNHGARAEARRRGEKTCDVFVEKRIFSLNMDEKGLKMSGPEGCLQHPTGPDRNATLTGDRT